MIPGTKNWRLRSERKQSAKAAAATVPAGSTDSGRDSSADESGSAASLRERVLGTPAGRRRTDYSGLRSPGQPNQAGRVSESAPRHSHEFDPLRDSDSQALRDELAAINSPDPQGGKDGVHRSEPPEQTPSASEAKPVRKSAVAHLDITVPERIEKYTLGARLGSGTCGVVHKALDEVLGREVAVKLSPVGEALASNGKVPGAQRAYQTEVYAAGRLRHPNIVTVYDAGQHQDLNYFVMEAVDGLSLKHYGKGQKLLPTYRALEIICECCMALDYTHRQDILHRDIKPANIMVARDGAVKLLDFGIAVGLSENSGLSRRGPTLGTPNYMSPEQILGKELGPASDFYSLGTVLFELLTGKQLFKAKKVKDLFKTVVHQPAPTLNEFRPDLPTGLSDALAKALQKKPELRYQSGVEFIDSLTQYIDHFRAIEDRPLEDQAMLPEMQSLSFFSSFTAADIARLTTHAPLKTVSAGTDLLPHSNAGRELLVLIDGSVRVDNKEGFYGTFGPGECIGEMGFIHGTPEQKVFTALTDMKVLHIGPDVLSALPPKLHLHYYKRISDTLVERMASLATHRPVDVELG